MMALRDAEVLPWLNFGNEVFLHCSDVISSPRLTLDLSLDSD